jgi:hypothetical protein
MSSFLATVLARMNQDMSFLAKFHGGIAHIIISPYYISYIFFSDTFSPKNALLLDLQHNMAHEQKNNVYL